MKGIYKITNLINGKVYIGNVGAAANGKLKSSGGFIWKFKE
jgi:hypothetical protein